MFNRTDILLGFVVPWLVCAGILAAAWKPWRRDVAPRDGRWAGGIALAAAYAIAYGRCVGELGFPAASPDNWVVHAAGLGALVGLAFCLLRMPKWARPATACALAAVLCFLLLKPLLDAGSLSRAATVAWVAGGAVAMTFWWLGMTQLARFGPRMLAPAVAMLVAIGGAAVLGEGGLAQRGGFTLGAMAVILGASLAVATFTKGFSLAGGGMIVTTLVILGTLLYAWFYIYPDPSLRMKAAILIVVASPILSAIAWLPGIRKRSSWLRGTLALIAVLLGIATAISLLETDHAAEATSASD